MGDVGYSVGFVDYNYSKPENSVYDIAIVELAGGDTEADAGFEEAYVGFSYGPASVTYYDMQDSDYDYTVFGLDAGAASFAYGRHDLGGGAEMDHFDFSYAVNDSVALTLSKPEELDTVVVASYSVSF